MFDNLDDPSPMSVTDTDLAQVRARAIGIRRARQHTAAAVGSSAFAVVAVVGAATFMASRHASPVAKPGNATPSETPPAPISPPPATSTASPRFTSSPSSFARCSEAYRKLIPSYLPAGFTEDSGFPPRPFPADAGSRSWTDNPGHLTIQTAEVGLFLACSGGDGTAADGNRVVQDITVNGHAAVLWHAYGDTMVGVQWDMPSVGWLALTSRKTANGEPDHRLSDAEMLKIANSMPTFAP